MVSGFDVITFGSAVVDIFVDTDVSEKGKFMQYPVGSKLLAKELRFDVGGGGTNTAVAFSRFGFKTGYIGKMGDDMGGKRILSLLKKENVEFLGRQEKDATSGYSVILDSKEDNRTVLTYKGINNEMKNSDLKKSKIKTKWLYLSSLLGKSFETQKKLVNNLHKKDVKIAFNPSDYLIKRKNLKPILKKCEVLILNKEEAEMLIEGKNKKSKKKIKGGKQVENLLKGLQELGPRVVVVTNKDKETMAFDGDEFYSIKPHKVKVVERTGAGDAFASAFVAGQIAGKSIDDSLKLGLEESESVIKYVGTKNKLIKRKLKK